MADGGNPNFSRSRTPEEHAAVRRRALPVALGAFICGVAGVVLPWRETITAFHTPSLLAVNLACSALLMGAGILFYARGTPGTRVAVGFCIAAIVLGLIGPLIYSKQAVDNRMAREQWELASVRKIAQAARAYAGENGGVYPGDLLKLVEEGRVEAVQLQSPFGMPHEVLWRYGEAEKEAREKKVPRAEWLKSVETVTDYYFVAPDLRDVPADLEKVLLVARSRNTVLRSRIALSFADGSAGFYTEEEFAKAAKASNDAREKMGLRVVKYWEALGDMRK